jgi:hypothetical protein
VEYSLFVTGTAPAIDLSGQLATGVADMTLHRPRRIMRFLRSTFSARKQVINLAAEGTSKPPTTAIMFQDSVCSTEGAGHSTVLASATHWPSITSSAHGWLSNLSWASVSSLYLGFDRLIDLDKTSFQVKTLDDWQRVWGKKYTATQFQPLFWQESTIADISSVMPFDFDTSKLPYHDVKTGSGQLPGCPIDRLKIPEVISQARLLAISLRPKFPDPVLKPTDAVATKKVDLQKEDLGAILNRNDWQSGTLFEATGSGLRFMSPVKLSGRSVRIIFRQGDGAPLKVQPKVPDQKAKPDFQGLFNIENGTLDVQSAVLEVPQTMKGAAPPWLISSKNASIILRGCQLNGPMLQDLEQHQGLIQWITTGANPPPAGTEPVFLSVNDSLLFGPGIGIRAECSQGNVFVRNSILAIRGNGLNIQPVRSDDKLFSNIDLQHVTFSTTRAVIHVDAEKGTMPISSPMRFYVDYCAIVPPLEFKSGDSADASLVECEGPVREQNQMEWWSNSNGVARDVRVLLRQAGAGPITAVADWNAAWGDSHVVRMLTGGKSVHLSTALPVKWANLKAASFTLDPKCSGATWAEGGRPLGADIRTVEDAMQGKKTTADVKPGPAPPVQPTKPKNPRDVGF